jgi:hypothetical protein
MISRKILDIILIWHDIQKRSGYHRRIYWKFRDIIPHGVNIRKVSVFYLVQGEYPESIRIINSYAASSRWGRFFKLVYQCSRLS